MKNPVPALVAVLLFVLAGASSAQADLQSVWGGVSIPTPMGDSYASVQRMIGFQGNVLFDNRIIARDISIRLTGLYQPFSLRTNDSLKLYTGGALAGIHLPGKTSIFGTQLTFAVQAGAVYNSLRLTSQTTSNAATAFAARVTQGLDIPIYGHLGLVAELPVTAVFAAKTFVTWSAEFSLRWKL